MNKTYYFGIFLSILALSISCQNKEEEEDPQYGKPMSNHGCNDHKIDKSGENIPDTLSCVYYTYNMEKKQLHIEHKNTAFNCCVDLLLFNDQIQNDTILIKEMEHNGQCDCLCLYDVEMKVENVKPQKYILKIDEAYTENILPFIIELHLDSINTGEHCLTRHNYPYGINKK